MMKKIVFLAALPFALAAVPAAAQDSESYAIHLNGTVASNCELVPEGSGTFDVNMLETGNQGSLTILYSCNSPYTVSLQSQYGGMRHQQSGGAVNIDYDVESIGFGKAGGANSTNSATMLAPKVIGTNNDWANILTNGGVRTGNLDLSFDSLAEYAVAGTYEDTLTITLAASF
jgi:type 1 fimbria pilin